MFVVVFYVCSGVGNAGAPGAGAPVKFYWSEVEYHPCACTAAWKLHAWCVHYGKAVYVACIGFKARVF